MALSLQLVSEFWAKSGELGSKWTPPTVVHYRNGATPLDIACDKGNTDEHKWDDNAVYCSADDTVYLNDDFMKSLFTSFQAMGVIGVVTHEMGHRANYLAGRSPTLSISEENQADCDAGAVVAYAVTQGTLSDVDAFVTGAQQFLKLGLSSGRAWWVNSAHGTPEQRLDAFAWGAKAEREGASASQSCWDHVGRADPGLIMTINDYTLKLETGATVIQEYVPPSQPYAQFTLPERKDMVGRIYAAKVTKGTTAADLWPTWLDSWSGKSDVTLRADSLDPFVVIFDGGRSTEGPFLDLFFSQEASNTATASTYYNASHKTFGIVCAAVSKDGDAFFVDIALPVTEASPSSGQVNSVKAAFYNLTTTVTTAIALAEEKR